MEFEFLVEDGEFFVEDAEVERLMESLELSEDEVMELVSEALEDIELSEMEPLSKEAAKAVGKRQKERFVANVKADPKGIIGHIKKYSHQKKRLADHTEKSDLMKKLQDAPKGAKIAAGVALGGAALGAAGYGAKKLLDKRKAKKEADAQAQSLKECMIDLLIDEDCVYVPEEEIDFLMEACDYSLTEDEIFENISENISEALLTEKTKVGKLTALRMNVKQLQRLGKDVAADPGNQEAYLARYYRQRERTKANTKSLMDSVKDAPKGAKIAAGVALGGAALGAAGYGVKKLLDKRKAKKEADAKAESLKECMIDLVQEGQYIYISESDMDFLLEACDYSLTESEILTNIAEAKEVDEYFPGDGIVKVTSDKYMSSLPEKQEVDMPEKHCDNGMMADCSVAPDTKEKIKKPKCMHEDVDDLLDEATELLEESEDLLDDIEDLLDESLDMTLIDEDAVSRAEKKVAKAERKLKRAKDIRKTMDEVEKSKVRHGLAGRGIGGGIGTGARNASTAKSIVRGRDRQDRRIEKAERKLAKAKEKLEAKKAAKSEAVQYSEYSESFEGDHLINEAILTDCNIQLTEDEMFDLISENLLSERSIVRLDKQAKRSQAEAKALIVIAREQNDPLYKKLVKCYKQKQAILSQLDSKYGSRAIARVRKNAGKMNVDK